ncbi:MAG: ribosome hibernation-promoting factor, HPF/YfiA family [Bacteroidales bacterium]|jgi:putative sigma-54 modulation protein
MDIKIHSIHFDADTKLLDFIESKLNKLLLFHDGIINAEVFLRLENVEGKENKITEVRLEIPGNPVFAKKQSSTFEESTDNVVEALRRQLQKQKGKLKRA